MHPQVLLQDIKLRIQTMMIRMLRFIEINHIHLDLQILLQVHLLLHLLLHLLQLLLHAEVEGLHARHRGSKSSSWKTFFGSNELGVSSVPCTPFFSRKTDKVNKK